MDYKSLKTILLHHDKLYYDDNNPQLPDAEYDALFDQLNAMEQKQGWRDSDSPTQRINSNVGKIRHPHTLYSIKKVYDEKEVEFPLCLPKLDGANLSASYKNGNLNTLLTRGNGEFGQSCIHLASAIKDLPTSVDSEYVFLGEAMTDNLDAENYRNYVSGALGLDSVEEARTRNLRFIVHDVLGLKADYLDRLAYAESKGFDTVLQDMSMYPQDGLVYRVKTWAEEQTLGYTAKYPRFIVALKKKESFSAATNLIDVEWAVGRSGVVTPIGLVDPVQLDGAIVSRLTLHNMEFIETHNLGRGDTILIERQITPQFVKVIQHSEYPRFDLHDVKSAINADVYRVGPKLYTDSDSGFRLVEHYVKSLEIKGIGPASIKKLNIQHPIDLYSADWDSLGKVAGGIKEELYRPKPYSQVLGSLGIPGVGKIMAKKIVQHISRFEDLETINHIEIPGFAQKSKEKILAWLDVNADWVYDLPYTLEEVVEETAARKICISGKLDMTKKELGDRLSKFGFKLVDNVTKDCYILISDGKESGKYKSAVKYGIPVMDYYKNRINILQGLF